MASYKVNNRNTESTDEESKYWTCSVLERGPWLKQLPKTLAADDPNFRTLWEECFITEKNVAYTQSPSHSYHLSVDNIKKHGLTDPCPLLTFTKLNNAIADAKVEEALAKGFREAPTALKTWNRLLHDRILFYISNVKGREDYEREANGNYITLIKLIVAEDNDADAEIATWANTEKNKLVKAGLSSNTIVAFDHFRLQFENYNDMCKQGAGGRRDDDSVIATIYTDIVRDLGDLIETKLEMKLEAAAATGNLPKTVKVIRRLLGRMEGKATSSGAARAAAADQRQSDDAFNAAAIASARAAAGRDPIIGGGGGVKEERPPAVWTKGKHKPCTLCKNQSNKNHLRKWCPENPTPGVDPVFAAEREAREKERGAAKKNKRKEGGARMAATSAETDSGSDSDDSDTHSDCSDCSEQSVYDDEEATSVQSADAVLSDTFFTPGASATFNIPTAGSARVAVGERPAHSDLAQVQANALAESQHAARLARSEHALLQAQREGAAAAAELARHRALVAAQAAPKTPTTVTANGSGEVTIGSLFALSAEDRAAITPLRRDDARRLVASLDPVGSPLLTMQVIARAADLSEVRLGCGPPSGDSTVNRTKAHVLADMRVAVGLSPVAVPMGLPIKTGGGDAASSPAATSNPTFLLGDHVARAPTEATPAPPPPLIAQDLCSAGTCWLSMCTCGIDWNSHPLPLPPPVPLTDTTPTQTRVPPAVDEVMPPPVPVPGEPTSASPPNGTDFGLAGFDARGGAGIMGKQIVADLQGDPATRYNVQLADGTMLQALCPLSGPSAATTPPPGAIYLGIDACHTRIWATIDGQVICTATKSIAAANANITADAPPFQSPPPSNGWFNRRTMCYVTMALLTHFVVLGVAVGWAAGRPSTGIGFIVGLPSSAHEAGTLARRSLDLFSLPFVTHTVISLTVTAMRYFVYIGTTLLRCCCLPVTLLLRAAICPPAQRLISCQGCLLTLVAATSRSIMHIIGYCFGGLLGTAACIMVPCIATWATYAALSTIPTVVSALVGRLRRARGRVSPLIPPGSPPPWDTSTIYNRHRNYIHRPHWEGRFAGTRRACLDHLVSAAINWHLPWWLLVLALQWMVVATLDVGARILDYRVAIRSYRETLHLLGDTTPCAASTAEMGRWMMRWLRRSYAGARRHISHNLRTLASSLLMFATYLLYNLLSRGISGITRGALGWLGTWLTTILHPLPHAGLALLRSAIAVPPVAHGLLWLLHANVMHRCPDPAKTCSWLQDILGRLLFISRLSLALTLLAWQHWTGTHALSIAQLPRAARAHPEYSATAIAAATAAATALPAMPISHEAAPHSLDAAASTLLPRGRVGYALASARQGKTRAKAKASRALPACSGSSLPSFWPTRHHVTRWLRDRLRAPPSVQTQQRIGV